MKFKVIASGSKGNCTYIECGDKCFLIDVGISYQKIMTSLKEDGKTPLDIDGIFISHKHDDHIKGLASFVKKTNTKVFLTKELISDLKEIIPKENIVKITEELQIGEIKVTLMPTSHDVKSYGFLIEYFDKSLVYITDTGYINRKFYQMTENKNIYIIEANHDEEMLMNGPYPYYLKQRVISDVGHLSNRYTGKYLKKIIGDNTRYIFLAHLSEKNNTKELALSQVKEELEETDFNLEKILIADQYTGTEVMEVS